jgi:hypothetical protein
VEYLLEFTRSKSLAEGERGNVRGHEIATKPDQVAELPGAEVIDDRDSNIGVPPLQVQGEI